MPSASPPRAPRPTAAGRSRRLAAETPGPKTVVLVSAGFAIALDAGVFDELAIRAALSDVAVDAVLVEPVAAPSSRKLVPANIISERRSLMRRLSELATSALGTAHSAVGGSQEPFDRLMSASTRYRLDVRPAADGARDVAAKVTAAVAGAGLSVKVRPYFVPPAPGSSTAATTPDARVDPRWPALRPQANAAAPGRGRLSGAALPGDTALLLIAGEVPPATPVEVRPRDGVPTPGPPALTIGHLLLDRKKQPVRPRSRCRRPSAARRAGAAPTRIAVLRRGRDGWFPDTYTPRVVATDSRGRVGLVEREIVPEGHAGGASSATS